MASFSGMLKHLENTVTFSKSYAKLRVLVLVQNDNSPIYKILNSALIILVTNLRASR
jgi:hypothetical protein